MDGGFDFAEVDPHRVRASADETDGECVRLESTLYPRPPDAPAGAALSHEPWSLDYRVEHVHPEQEERWRVRAGTLAVTVDGEHRTLSAGEEATLPAGVPHEHWNPSEEPARVVWERRPGARDAAWAESLFALAQRGQTDENGVPSPLQFAVVVDAHPTASVYLPRVPTALQRAAFSALGALGRALGYEAEHVRPSRDA